MFHRKNNQRKGRSEEAREEEDLFSARSCCPCYVLGSVFRGIGRCLFVACYPVIQCCGLDECRHHHNTRLNHFR
ncbi:hypothetical protein QOZ80_5AG0377560 [Eleusine coracana subsp. coracana]|nr:hypothetical protein QOZ80_5AG0377560 [Eleusine coracana subsp. coracana]